jgi:hypothetical protein
MAMYLGACRGTGEGERVGRGSCSLYVLYMAMYLVRGRGEGL